MLNLPKHEMRAMQCAKQHGVGLCTAHIFFSAKKTVGWEETKQVKMDIFWDLNGGCKL